MAQRPVSPCDVKGAPFFTTECTVVGPVEGGLFRYRRPVRPAVTAVGEADSTSCPRSSPADAAG
jgi:hypothetical protein